MEEKRSIAGTVIIVITTAIGMMVTTDDSSKSSILNAIQNEYRTLQLTLHTSWLYWSVREGTHVNPSLGFCYLQPGVCSSLGLSNGLVSTITLSPSKNVEVESVMEWSIFAESANRGLNLRFSADLWTGFGKWITQGCFTRVRDRKELLRLGWVKRKSVARPLLRLCALWLSHTCDIPAVNHWHRTLRSQ